MQHDSEDTMHKRASDVAAAPIHIGREIPLWGLVTAFVIFAGQAISVYYGQASQGEKLTRLESTSAQINVKLDQITAAQNAGALKDLEHDFKITSLATRVATLENELQRLGSRK